jgi:energy-coupling factor transporter ATP-binding protein EcfA2
MAFPMENFGWSKKRMKERIDRLLTLLEIEHLRKKSPFEISGGEQQLVALAAALALNPPILVLDEITANISPRSARGILRLLKKLHEEQNKTIILSEHKTDYCINLVNKLVYLEAGEIIAQGKPENVLLNKHFPQELYPKIPALYLKLNEKLSIKQKTTLPKDRLPITVDQLVTMLGIQEEKN